MKQKKYFANILWPYAKLIDKALAKAAALDLKMIATAHGIIWRSHIQEIIAKYAAWGQRCERQQCSYCL